MKNFKLLLLSFAIIASFLTSCTNNEPVIEDQNIDESEAITTTLNQLRQQFNDNGDLLTDANPTGNIVFDFCFDFVYPLNLSYNNGTIVTVNDLEGLIQIMINSSDDLYVDGIEFPFNVETFNEDSNSIEVITINNEDEFFDLLENCDFETSTCECFEDYNPVCVEIEAPDGQTFLMTYPNACYALCDGFTENDFSENCEEDYNSPGGTDCFTLNFPLTIISDTNTTITVNSQEELDNALYNSYYFNFVYPFDVTLDNDEVVTITSESDIEDILEDCFGEYQNPCDCFDDFNPVCVQIEEEGEVFIFVFPNACLAECEGFTAANFVDCDNQCTCPDVVDPVCVEIESPSGGTEIITFLNSCEAECEGFTESDFIDCGDTTTDCTPNTVVPILLECAWTVNDTLTYTFQQNGVLTITGENVSVNATWFIIMGDQGYPIVIITDESGNYNDEWAFEDCNLMNSIFVNSLVNPSYNIVINCG